MRADSFAKLIVLDAVIEAEVGYHLERPAESVELFRETMVGRISDLIDEIDAPDSATADRIYDAIVDFLAELPEDDEGVVESAIRLRQAVRRIIDRGMDRRTLAAPSTWAIVVSGLLAELSNEYHVAIGIDGTVRDREFARALALLERARMAADRMLWSAGSSRGHLLDEVDRLAFAARNRRISPTDLDPLIRAVQGKVTRYRPSTFTQIGSFVLRQVMRRNPRGRPEAPSDDGPRRRAGDKKARRAG